MGINDILSMGESEFMNLNRTQLAKLTSQLASAGNKRLVRMEKNGITTPASRYVEQSGGKFSVADKSVNELRHEFMRAKGFLTAKTGTQAGFNKVVKQTLSKVGAKTGKTLSKSDFDKFWKAYERLKEKDPSVATSALKYMTLAEISNQVDDGKDLDSIVNDIGSQLDDIYEGDDTDEFFDMDDEDEDSLPY